jgi:hypothetical protein
MGSSAIARSSAMPHVYVSYLDVADLLGEANVVKQPHVDHLR